MGSRQVATGLHRRRKGRPAKAAVKARRQASGDSGAHGEAAREDSGGHGTGMMGGRIGGRRWLWR